MRAVTFSRYGSPDVLETTDTPVPTPAADQVLVTVTAASVNPLDWHEMRGLPYVVRLGNGIRSPKEHELGSDFAGTVAAVGAEISGFAVGDEVFGSYRAAFAEFAVVPERALSHRPSTVNPEQASGVGIAGYTALQALRDHGHVEKGQSVLVNGASGGVGTLAVQLAVHFGARVTGVCSAGNAELVRSLGADRVLDYSAADFTRMTDRYDLIVDAVGNHPLGRIRRALTPTGALVMVGARHGNWIAPLVPFVGAKLAAPFTKQRLISFLARRNKTDLLTLTELLEAGTLRPVIDSVHPLDRIRDAMVRAESGHARGKVIVTMQPGA